MTKVYGFLHEGVYCFCTDDVRVIRYLSHLTGSDCVNAPIYNVLNSLRNSQDDQIELHGEVYEYNVQTIEGEVI